MWDHGYFALCCVNDIKRYMQNVHNALVILSGLVVKDVSNTHACSYMLEFPENKIKSCIIYGDYEVFLVPVPCPGSWYTTIAMHVQLHSVAYQKTFL